MDTTIKAVNENPLLGRFEVKLEVEHAGEPTPSQEDVVSRIAAEKNLEEDNIEVDGIYTGFGSKTSTAELKIHEEFEYDEEEFEQEEVEEEEADAEDEEETTDKDKTTSDVDYEEIVSGTIGDAKDELEELDEVDWEEALQAEKDNKNRTTFTDWLMDQTE